jgi:NTP pyrophosphatase (non-canonical NTP hydrolase)
VSSPEDLILDMTSPEGVYKLYAAALQEYGEDAQVDMLIEECSELVKALLKLRRAKERARKHMAEQLLPISRELQAEIDQRRADIIEELADVCITHRQMIVQYERGPIDQAGHTDYDYMLRKKQAKLAARLGLLIKDGGAL